MKLVIVSNRLPVHLTEEKEKKIFKQSPGGLVQGLSSSIGTILEITNSKEFYWVGWPGETVSLEEQESVKNYLFENFNAIPVFLTKEEMDDFYLGFCNTSLWPIFHSFTSYAKFFNEQFNSYIEVNKKFASTLVNILEKDDIVWMHDYHLMLLPYFLKKNNTSVKVGFFLHIPFPSYEIFIQIPKKMREKILEGLLNADLIGFHTHRYRENFIKTVRNSLPIEEDGGTIIYNDRVSRTGVFPISIDFDRYANAKDNPKVKENLQKLKGEIYGKKVVLSIDRLDYSKGIVNKLRAIERFLEKYPEFQKNIIFIVVVVPSRIGVDKYNETKEYIEYLIGKINGKFGEIGWVPINYLFKNLPFEELVPLYIIGDVLLVTSLADGMNLVSKEFLATSKDGVLILSELTGAAEDLRDAMIISPNDIEDIADKLKIALQTDKKTQLENNRNAIEYLKKYDIKKWTTSFLTELSQTVNFNPIYLNSEEKENIIENFVKAQKKALILDYDGTLVPFSNLREKTFPGKDLVELLKDFVKNDTYIAISSGRRKESLEQFFKNFPITLIAEHGAFVKEPNTDWKEAFDWVDTSFKEKIIDILNLYKDRVPGAEIEEKQFSVVFHYRNAKKEIALPASRELYDILVQLTANTNALVLKINNGIEIKPQEINKGIFVSQVAKRGYDFILFAGDDSVDEEAFKVSNKYGYSIRVGKTNYTNAKYYVNSTEELVSFLKVLLNSISKKEKGSYIKNLIKRLLKLT
ncbi:MAG: bifunctional alpha,alpha-trehalose-phosphate synthase (UDP-forming)/trehalose-phosphatase [Caldisericaceae bacterium]